MSKKVAVLGLGASGLFAAKAAKDCGCEVTAYTLSKEITFPPGPFWLHWIPENVQDKFELTPIFHIGKGTASNYQALQWGRLPKRKFSNSFPAKNKHHYGYNPTEVLPTFVPEDIKVLSKLLTDADIGELAEEYDVVFQTFATDLSKQQQLAFLPYTMASQFDLEDAKTNYVIYNGTKKGIIVREIQLWHNKFLEFPKYLPIKEIRKGTPLSNFQVQTLWDLDPFAKLWRQPSDANKKICLVGRWAEWNKDRLSHDAYAIAQRRIQNG